MLENIVICHSDNGEGPIDAGLLAEAMLFYQNVHVLADYSSLIHLIRTIGHEPLLTAIEHDLIKITFLRQQLVVHTTRDTGIPVHRPVGIEFVGHEPRHFRTKKERLEYIFQRALANDKDAKLATKRFIDKSAYIRTSDGIPHKLGIPGIAHDDFKDNVYMQRAAEIVLRHIAPESPLPPGWRFRAIEVENGYVIDSNIDFERLPRGATPAHVLVGILRGTAGVCLASKYASEITITPMQSELFALKLGGLLAKREANRKELEYFQHMHLEDAHALREAINSGERSFSEFLELLSRAEKFRNWLKGAHPDNGLLKEYHRAVMSDTWLSKLPQKVKRFSLFTGGGLLADIFLTGGIASTVGVTASAFDTFVMDRLRKGWKPNIFVEKRLRPFIQGED